MKNNLGKILFCLIGIIFIIAGGVMCAYEDFTLGPIIMAVGAISIISVFRRKNKKN